MQLTKNFSRKELECKCGCGQCNIEEDFLKVLQGLRTTMGIPIHINSAYRCREHNISVGGSIRSMHLAGKAADIRTGDWDTTLFVKFLRACLSNKKIKGYGFGKGFLHIDIRDTKDIVAWRY